MLSLTSGRENDSGYGSNGSNRAESIRVESAPTEGIRSETTASEDRTETAPKPPPPCPRPCRPPRPFPLAYRKDLFLIDQPVPANVRQRWLSIQGPLSWGLAAALRESDELSKQASMRLVMLGKGDNDAADARPCIVVFCVEAQWKRVRKYFEQRNVRDLYRSRGDDPGLPLFDFYLGPPLRPRVGQGGVDIFMPRTNVFPWQLNRYVRETLCGTPITLRHSVSRSTSIATLGGIIKVTSAENQVVCYGMTAGHTIPLPPSASSTAPAFSTSIVHHTGHHDAATPSADYTTRWAVGEGQPLGTVMDGCLQQVESFDGGYYDWALCNLPIEHLTPNYLPLLEGAQPHIGGQHDMSKRLPELQTVDTTFKTAVEDISVVVITGSGGPKRGWLATLPCPAMLGPGSEFTTAYTVAFPDYGAICDGDSGSWVVNENTLEVIGHIVATDDLDDAYVIPLADIFEDMKHRLGARAVELAPESSIRSVNGVVFDSLNRVGIPQLDAIRGNGVTSADIAVSRLNGFGLWGIKGECVGSDSGYWSNFGNNPSVIPGPDSVPFNLVAPDLNREGEQDLDGDYQMLALWDF